LDEEGFSVVQELEPAVLVGHPREEQQTGRDKKPKHNFEDECCDVLIDVQVVTDENNNI
jgi:hypothetical protein